MKHLKRIVTAALAVAALTASLGAGSASATTLEVKGVKQLQNVTVTVSLKAGSSATLKDTFGFSSNTCTGSHAHGEGNNLGTGPDIVIALTPGEAGLSFSGCANPVTVHKGGALRISHTSGTNGTVTSSGAEVTTGSPFGTLTCVTGAGTHLGTLTGSAAGHATIAINATLSCSGISSKWVAEWVITTPTGLGVVA